MFNPILFILTNLTIHIPTLFVTQKQYHYVSILATHVTFSCSLFLLQKKYC